MELQGKKIGFAITGSYCTFDKTLPQIVKLRELGADIYPIISYNVAVSDTRFYKCADLKAFLREATGKSIIETIIDAEPIGPKKMLDLLIVAPCTGNTVAKIANGITDTAVTY